MKRAAAVLLAVLAFALCGCQDSQTDQQNQINDSVNNGWHQVFTPSNSNGG